MFNKEEWDLRVRLIRNNVAKKTLLNIKNIYKGGGPKKKKSSLPNLTMINKRNFLILLDDALKNHPEFNTPLWRDYFIRIALKESNFRLNATNPYSTALGYFQLIRANRKTGDLFEDMINLTNSNKKYLLKKFGNVTPSMMATAHFLGAAGAVDYIKTGKLKFVKHNATLGEYLKGFDNTPTGEYASILFGEDPLSSNINQIDLYDSTLDNNQLAEYLKKIAETQEALLAYNEAITRNSNNSNEGEDITNSYLSSTTYGNLPEGDYYNELLNYLSNPSLETVASTNILLPTFIDRYNTYNNMGILHLNLYDTGGAKTLPEVVAVGKMPIKYKPEDAYILALSLYEKPELVEVYLLPITPILQNINELTKAYALARLKDLEDLILKELILNDNVSNSTFQYALAEEDNKLKKLLLEAKFLLDMANISALGGPINPDNPIPNFALNTHTIIPAVRYADGGPKRPMITPRPKYREKINKHSDGGNLFAPGGDFDLWAPDSAKYRPEYDSRFSNVRWNKLNNNLLYSGDIVKDLDLTYPDIFYYGPFKNLQSDALTSLNRDLRLCLKDSKNWQSNKAGLWGVQGWNSLLRNYTIPKDMQMLEKDLKTGAYNKGGLNSWNMARALLGHPEIGRVIDIKLYLKNAGKDKWTAEDYANFPIGTLFNIGDALRKRYIGSIYGSYDENDNLYPSHTFSSTGFGLTKDGLYRAILNDYGNIVTDLHLYGPDKYPEVENTPSYAIIPFGSEHLTAENVMPRFELWKQEMGETGIPFIQGLDEVNQEFLKHIDADELRKLNEYYGIGHTTDILKRLMAIGTLESRLGYKLKGDDYDTNILRQAKYYTPGLFKSLIKAAETGALFDNSEIFDTKAGYEREMDIYNRLLKSKKLEGLNTEQILNLVNQEYNKEAKKFGRNYGKKNPRYEILNNSYGPFQVKDTPRNMKNFRNMDGEMVEEGSMDNVYTGYNPTLKVYNRLLANMLMIRNRYPNLSDDELLDAATISWNSGSKIANKDFIDLYIKKKVLTDNYLEKVKDFENKLYPSKKANGGNLFYDGSNIDTSAELDRILNQRELALKMSAFPIVNDEGNLVDFVNPIGATSNGNVYDSTGKQYEVLKVLPDTEVIGYLPILNKIAQEVGNGNLYWLEHPLEFWNTAKDVGNIGLQAAAIATGNPWINAAVGGLELASDNGVKKTVDLYNNEGLSANTVKSGLGDLLNATMVTPAVGEAYNIGKGIASTLKGVDNSLYGISKYSSPLDINIFEKMQKLPYLQYISGAMDVAKAKADKYISMMIPELGQEKKMATPDWARLEILNTTVNRIKENRPWIKDRDINNIIDRIFNLGYTVFPKSAYKKAGEGDFAGFFNPENGFISIRDGESDFALPHEIRHKIDDYIPLTEEEEDYLVKAFDSNFDLLGDKITASREVDMAPERVTTNRDARSNLLGTLKSQTWTPHQLNLLIEKVPDNKIVEAVENSNGYGRAYIKYLRDNNLLTKEKILQFRDSMKKVGIASIPIGLSLPTTLLYTQNNFQ